MLLTPTTDLCAPIDHCLPVAHPLEDAAPVPDREPVVKPVAETAEIDEKWFGGDEASAAEMISGDWVKVNGEDDWCLVSGPSPISSSIT